MFIRQSLSTTRRLFSTNFANELQEAKPFSQIPKISALKLVMGNLPGGKYYKKSIKDIQDMFYKEYGCIVKMPGLFGQPEMIFTFNADDFEKAFRAEGIWPVRFGIETLKHYRETMRPEIYTEFGSLGTSDGQKWQTTRTIVNPIMMQPKTVKFYTQQIDEIAKELVEIMRNIKNDKNEMPGNFSDYLNRWSLESIATIAVEKRLNVLSGKTDDENSKKLIKVIRQFFEQGPEFEGKPSIWKYYETKDFKNLIEVYDTMTSIVFNYVNEAIKRFETEEVKEGQEESILRKLLKVNKNVAFITASDLLIAGVDTTASGVTFILYLLAKNPEKQEKLRSEILKILPEKNSQIDSEKMKNLPYLRAVIKESFRMLPVAGGNARKVAKDVVLAGYHVPKDSLIVMSAYNELSNPKFYPEPKKFIPERWLRESKESDQWKSKENNPFSFLPFGFGARSCVGKRIAELETEVVVSNIIRNFKLEWDYPDIKIKGLFANIPDSEMRFKITET
ncbi:hypothetical protein PVAND_001689 [Polypedilum vanderplanki]|uniref:Cytochrome P450 n=1 Tax=Polypedilum vanderplanki TaxID=319348 RepID=A0A9J6BP48_POLVA|nr:hypothetical protein PVAND_001689 [Polypedilum vanderplanki]